MAKNLSLFVCKSCGNESAKWMGKCPVCGEWNTFTEVEKLTVHSSHKNSVKPKEVSVLKDVKGKELERIQTGIKELDKSLGGGLVGGQVLLLAGEPGIGKSTILLEVASNLDAFYVSGEESLSQIKIRTQRLGVKDDNIYCLSETNIDNVLATAENLLLKSNFKVLVIDSVQTMYTEDLNGTAGTVSQVRECALRLIRFAKKSGIPTILVGHVTKDGSVAGPSTLMHMVDTVCWFEGERQSNMRILRVLKNRFGATDEISLFAMNEKGLVGVSDIDSYFFSDDRITGVPGAVASCVMEGSRSLLVEVQSLVNPTKLAIPRRVVQGIDTKRVELILAVLTKHCRIDLSSADVFVNIVGGLKVHDPSLDLAVAVSIASSYKNKTLPANLAVIGEVGLLGDVRQGSQYKKCLKHLKSHKLNVVGPDINNIQKVINTIFTSK